MSPSHAAERLAHGPFPKRRVRILFQIKARAGKCAGERRPEPYSSGADNQSVWLSTDGRVSLGHTRLSIIDLDTGDMILGKTTVDEMGELILERVVQLASGEMQTKAELLMQNDFIPWKRGVSL